jgi:peptidoglycan/LPS O-acetylase OafA/YrhL
VILHHITGPAGMLESAAQSLPGPLFTLIRSGYLAVTTFFVLSGFVLARTYAKTTWNGGSLLRYAAGRVARVYPVYLLSLLVVSPFILADTAPRKGAMIVAHGFLVQAWFGSVPVSWNTPAWSLSCEMFFYAAFPLMLTVVARMNWRGALVAAAAACALTRILWAAGVPDEIKPLIHLSDFLMGVAASRCYDLLEDHVHWPGTRLYLPAATASAALIAWPRVLPSLIDLNTALRPLNALLLIGLAIGGGAPARALSTKPAVYLGKSSYAMYILHVPLLWWYARWTGSASGWVYVAAVIAISAAVYRFIEEPANRYLRRQLVPQSRPVSPRGDMHVTPA